MKLQRIMVFTLVAMLLVALLAACSTGTASSTSSSDSGGGENFNVTATEFAFQPDTFEGKVSQKITFKLTNQGTVGHTLVIQSPDGSSELAKLSTQPGETKTLEFTPTGAGTYPIVCDIAGHKEAGMKGQLVVK